jgi:hypothetical protein
MRRKAMRAERAGLSVRKRWVYGVIIAVLLVLLAWAIIFDATGPGGSPGNSSSLRRPTTHPLLNLSTVNAIA